MQQQQEKKALTVLTVLTLAAGEFSFHTMSFLPLNKKDKLTKVQLRSLLLVTLTTTAPAAVSGIIHWYYH